MDYAEYINLGGSDRLTAHQERDLFLAMEAGLVAGAVRDGRLRCRTVAASHELELIAAEGHRAKERLWQAHLPLALKLARAVGRDRSDIVEDLVQAACIGLAEAMMRFDLRRGLRFSTFAWPSIRRRIAEEAMRRDSSRPVWRRRTERIVALKEEALTAELGRQAEDAEIAAALEVEVAWVRARRGCGSDVSIGDLWVLEGLLPAEPGTGMDADWLAEARSLLPALQRRILDSHYGFNGQVVPREELAAELGISARAVRRMERSALDWLRAWAARPPESGDRREAVSRKSA